MAATGGTGRGSRKQGRKQGLAAQARPRLLGRPPRLAHLVAGSDRQQRRAQSIQASASAPVPPAWLRPATASGSHPAPPAAANRGNVLCLPNPDWLAHELVVSGPQAALARFRAAASGPGCIPWVTDYQRLEEDWVLEMLTPPPAARGISVAGARILARQLRERVEVQDMQAAEAAFARAACPLDLHALVPIPERILGLGANDPEALRWLWEHWGTTWPLRGVEALTDADAPATPPEKAELRYRFWSADWTPWRALASIKSRWPEMMFQIAVRAESE